MIRSKKPKNIYSKALLPVFLLLLLSCNLAFAGSANSIPYFSVALMIPLLAIAIAYMASYAFNITSLKASLHDELLQILATGAIALCLIGTQAAVDTVFLDAIAKAAKVPASAGTIQEAAIATLGSINADCAATISELQSIGTDLGKEASKGVFCNFMGVGFSINNCSPLNAYRGGLTLASFSSTAALADGYAQQFIINMAKDYAFGLIIPLGLLLRCFKMSRGAGGALIAVGFGFYTVYPTVIVSTTGLLHGNNNSSPQTLPPVYTCDPMNTDVSQAKGDFLDYGSDLTEYTRIRDIAYLTMVKSLFMSILNMIITLGFIRTFAHMLGSEIDVSSLARIS